MRIALFPLKTVLFPDGVLPLRVFEARYMDMVRDCMRDDAPFGVCLITHGGETGQPAQTEEIGCLARIGDWDMQQFGVLNIRCRGERRFRVVERRIEANGLLHAEIALLAPDDDEPLAPEHEPCANLLRRIIDDQRALDAGSAAQPAALPFGSPFLLGSSSWVGNRLCEVLPVSLKAKQKLMELSDARTRLDILMQYLRQHKIVA